MCILLTKNDHNPNNGFKLHIFTYSHHLIFYTVLIFFPNNPLCFKTISEIFIYFIPLSFLLRKYDFFVIQQKNILLNWRNDHN